jgi:serine/threonine protein kinase
MGKFDAAAIARLAINAGLFTEGQLRDLLDDLGQRNPDPDTLLRAMERKGILTPWQSQKLTKGDKEGYFLGGYRLLYRIASGTFSRVFRAADPHNGTVVAIKVLRRRWSEQRRTVELFEREGRMGQSLRHPNIVTILDVDFEASSRQYYIVMEFVEGGNLRDFLSIRGKLALPEALRLLDDATSGLTYAYSMGVTHRDIKPTNILISSQGVAKLVDFGLAEISSQVEKEDDAKVYRTVDYAGLEKATGVKPGDVRSDIYFLGCTFYEMLTGKSALVLTPDRRARIQADRFLNAPTLRAEDLAAPPGSFELVDHLLVTMMALTPMQRYQTPSALLEAIRDVRHKLDGSVPPRPAPPERTVFLIEPNRHLQDALRQNLKKVGYRVLLAAEPTAALNRYRQKPFDAIILDVGTAGADSLRLFERIMGESRRRNHDCAALLILSQDQEELAKTVPSWATVAVLMRPLNLGQLIKKLRELVPPK